MGMETAWLTPARQPTYGYTKGQRAVQPATCLLATYVAVLRVSSVTRPCGLWCAHNSGWGATQLQ